MLEKKETDFFALSEEEEKEILSGNKEEKNKEVLRRSAAKDKAIEEKINRWEKGPWREEEDAIILNWWRKNPDAKNISKKEAIEMAKKIRKRTPGAISARFVRLKQLKRKGLLNQGNNLLISETLIVTTEKIGKIITEFANLLKELEETTQALSKIYKDTEMLERWAKDTLVLRDRLKYTVDNYNNIISVKE